MNLQKTLMDGQPFVSGYQSYSYDFSFVSDNHLNEISLIRFTLWVLYLRTSKMKVTGFPRTGRQLSFSLIILPGD